MMDIDFEQSKEEEIPIKTNFERFEPFKLNHNISNIQNQQEKR
jgi:hypothetical protein